GVEPEAMAELDLHEAVAPLDHAHEAGAKVRGEDARCQGQDESWPGDSDERPVDAGEITFGHLVADDAREARLTRHFRSSLMELALVGHRVPAAGDDFSHPEAVTQLGRKRSKQ